MGGSLAPVRVAGFTWNGWQPSAVYAGQAKPLRGRPEAGMAGCHHRGWAATWQVCADRTHRRFESGAGEQIAFEFLLERCRREAVRSLANGVDTPLLREEKFRKEILTHFQLKEVRQQRLVLEQ